jgi:hypothetical protein
MFMSAKQLHRVSANEALEKVRANHGAEWEKEVKPWGKYGVLFVRHEGEIYYNSSKLNFQGLRRVIVSGETPSFDDGFDQVSARPSLSEEEIPDDMDNTNDNTNVPMFFLGLALTCFAVSVPVLFGFW